MRVLVLGAAGSGTTTLAAAVAALQDIPHIDLDDIYWVPSDPPYRQSRDAPTRQAMLAEATAGREAWAVSGSPLGWDAPIRDRLTLAVLLHAPVSVRLARLRAREAERFGAAIAPGGNMAESHAGFLDWAAAYDEGTRPGRSRALHHEWLATLACPVLRLDGVRPVPTLVAEVMSAASGADPAGPGDLLLP